MTPSIDLYAIRHLHGGTVYAGGTRWVGPGPGHSRKDASLSVMLTGAGRPVVHSFAGQDFRDCLAHLGLSTDTPRASKAEIAAAKREREAEQRREREASIAFCRAVWEGTQPLEGSPAETYLYSRGLIFEGSDVRYHPQAPRGRREDASRHGAMVALVRDADGAPCGLHVTFVTQDGHKAFQDRSRLMFGPVRGGAVRLAPIGSDGVLGLSEGLENAGAFNLLKGVPCWAALSTAGLKSFESPPQVRRLLIAADSDDKTGEGLASARSLAERMSRRCDAEVWAAPAGKDWADVLKETAQ